MTVAAQGEWRYPPEVEAAAYFCALEALQNATKYAGPGTVRVEVDAGPAALSVSVTDDGRGFDPSAVTAGTGVTNMRDRIDSVGGTVDLNSAPGRGTRLAAVIPVSALVAVDGGG